MAEPEPRRPRQDSSLTRAVFADGQLWLLSDAGRLFVIAEGSGDSAEVALPEPALDLWVQDGQPAVVTCERANCTEWTLHIRTNGQWVAGTKIAAQNDGLVAAGHAGKTVTLLTTRRIIDVEGDTQNAIRLLKTLHMKGIPSVHITPEDIFVGFNAGEWGGGLQRIDRKTGRIAILEHNASGQLCGGPLNTDCDPVNGIASLPWKPGCVALAVGLVHFISRGRIVEICGNDVRQMYFKRYGDAPPDTSPTQRGDEPFSTVAFFGLASRGDALWAVGIDGLYRIGSDGAVKSTPLPEFKRIGGFSVSFDLPDVVLVLTDVNRRLSVSGAVPILAPR